MKKLGMLAGVVVLVGVMAGCSIISDIGRSFHESNATAATLKTSIEKLNAAVPKAAERAGYTVNQSTSAAAESLFEGKGIEITTKKLGVGFATALETARQKAGDCTEHAVLAAALARAAGIPSRVVIGMAYADAFCGLGGKQFLYHMWTEVYVGEWLPIDPALGAHDATHIALGRSNLDRPGAMLEVSAPVPLFLGTTQIEVVE